MRTSTRATTDHETHAVVRDYCSALAARLQGRHPRGGPLARQNGRNSEAGSRTQRQYRRISAVLIGHGLPYLNEHKPACDYSPALRQALEQYIRNNGGLLALMEGAVDAPPSGSPSASQRDLDEVFRAPPQPGDIPEALAGEEDVALLSGVDYLGREQRNRALARAGEAFVIELEQRRLIQAGCDVFADHVEHVSGEYSKGLGYDIHSYEVDGRDRLIAVKTTRFRKETPFYVVSNEVAVSARYRARFWLYRVYNFQETPFVYQLNGPLSERFHLKPHEYRATVR